MERRPLLDSEDSRFWSRLRCRLLIVFWIGMAAMLGSAAFLIFQSYQPTAPPLWYQRRALCASTNRTDLRPGIRSASLLGCGGIITQLDLGESAESLVTEGWHYDLRVLLDIPVPEGGNGSEIQAGVRRWILDGVSGFLLSGSSRDAVMTVSDLLLEELEGDVRDDRIILLPDWLCEENVSNKSRLLHTCLLPEWGPLELIGQQSVMRTAWKVPDEDSPELTTFLAATLPGTLILPLPQMKPPPSWLHPLLFLRYQSPALYSGWLQPASDNSTFSILSQWRCSTLLITLNLSNETARFSLLRPGYTPTASLLLSTQRGRNRGQTLREEVLLEPGEAQLLRLTREEP